MVLYGTATYSANCQVRVRCTLLSGMGCGGQRGKARGIAVYISTNANLTRRYIYLMIWSTIDSNRSFLYKFCVRRNRLPIKEIWASYSVHTLDISKYGERQTTDCQAPNTYAQRGRSASPAQITWHRAPPLAKSRKPQFLLQTSSTSRIASKRSDTIQVVSERQR